MAPLQSCWWDVWVCGQTSALADGCRCLGGGTSGGTGGGSISSALRLPVDNFLNAQLHLQQARAPTAALAGEVAYVAAALAQCYLDSS